MLALRERRMKVTQALAILLWARSWEQKLKLCGRVVSDQADMRKAKEKALYKKKGSYPEGMYL